MQDVPVTIVMYLRRQDEFVESMYTQSIHQGGGQGFDDFVEQFHDRPLQWHRLVDAYGARFGYDHLVVRRYHRAFLPENDSLIRDFLLAVGLRPSIIEALLKNHKADTPNKGYSAPAIAIARLTNPYLNREEQKQLRKILQENAAKELFSPYSYWYPHDKKAFLAEYTDSNRAILQRFYPGTTDQLFPEEDLDESVSSGVEISSGVVSVEAIVPIIMKSIIHLSEKPVKTRPSFIYRAIARARRVFDRS